MERRTAQGRDDVVRSGRIPALRRTRRFLAIICALAGIAQGAEPENEETTGLNSLPEVEFKALSQHDWNPLGSRALAIHSADWKHGETEHFIYHFVHSYVATPISVEAEFNFRVIAKELGLETMPGGSGKSHIYIFEEPEDWKSFQEHAHLEPWTGGIHSLGSLFVVRDPSFKFANNSLGHEIAHLMLFRVYQRALPRWLDEGFAEYVSRVARASYQRARHYNARARSDSIPAEEFIPLARLTTLTDYPGNDEIKVFYQESERLVRFLSAADPAGFRALLDSVARGEGFDTALSRHYSGRFFDVDALEKDFLPYASKDAKTVAASP
ncbi:MAG: hypothetical protein ABIR29_12960 [Chthoniobacterales bacterium]